MTFHGIVQNGQIIISGDEPLPEGVAVDVVVSRPSNPPAGNGSETLPVGELSLAESLKTFVGAIKDLPSDFAERHDSYIHGTPDA